MSLTITESAVCSSGYTPHPPATPITLFSDFKDILKKFEGEKDYLSSKLLVQGREFVIYALEEQEQPKNIYLLGLIQRIENLKETLRNPFTKSTLTDPWLVNDLVWEKSMLDDYRRRLHAYSGVIVEATPHEFAKEVLGWIDRLPIKNNTTALQTVKTPDVTVAKYEKMVELVMTGRANHALHAMNTRLMSTLEETYKRQEQQLLQHEQDVEKQTAEMVRNIDTIRNEQKQTLETQDRRYESLGEKLEQVKKASQQEAKKLERRVRQAKNQCEQEKMEHQKDVEAMAADIEEIRDELHGAKTDLDASKKQIANLEAYASYLNSQVEYSQSQVSALANQMNNQDDGFCTVM